MSLSGSSRQQAASFKLQAARCRLQTQWEVLSSVPAGHLPGVSFRSLTSSGRRVFFAIPSPGGEGGRRPGEGTLYSNKPPGFNPQTADCKLPTANSRRSRVLSSVLGLPACSKGGETGREKVNLVNSVPGFLGKVFFAIPSPGGEGGRRPGEGTLYSNKPPGFNPQTADCKLPTANSRRSRVLSSVLGLPACSKGGETGREKVNLVNSVPGFLGKIPDSALVKSPDSTD